jgi:NAD(P)-dependent dehydrogenase (short-subunit alcohol dehydrogenase family)
VEGQVGIVTGAGKGLGRAFALHLAAAGAAVVVNNRNRTVDDDGRGPADHVVDEITAAGGHAVADTHDVLDDGAGEAMVELALGRFGRLDFLVTSAGISRPELFHKTTRERFEEILAINVAGTARVALACIGRMRAQESGRIVLVASGAGIHGEPTSAAYAASKGAVVALGRTLAGEGIRRGVLTNVLLPYAATQMTESMPAAWRAAMDPALVAPVVTALVDPTSTLNGQVIVSAGGALRAVDAVEYRTVEIGNGPLDAAGLAGLLNRSRAGPARAFPDAMSAFADLAGDVTRGPA